MTAHQWWIMPDCGDRIGIPTPDGEPLPDAAGDMYAAREAAIHRAYGEALLAEAKQGNMRAGSISRIVERARAAVPDSPDAVEVYGGGEVRP